MGKKQSTRATVCGRITADEAAKFLRQVRKAPAVFTREHMGEARGSD